MVFPVFKQNGAQICHQWPDQSFHPPCSTRIQS